MNKIISKQIYHEKERKQARKKYDIAGHEGRHKKEQERKKERGRERERDRKMEKVGVILRVYRLLPPGQHVSKMKH